MIVATNQVIGLRMDVIMINQGRRLTLPHLRILKCLRKLQGWAIQKRPISNMAVGSFVDTQHQVIIA